MRRCAMMPPMRNVSFTAAMLAVVAGLFTATACAPADDTSSATSSAAPAETCAKDSLTTLAKGSITFGTDQPAYPPWFVDDDPTNGKGFESAGAYAVADELGYAKGDVKGG